MASEVARHKASEARPMRTHIRELQWQLPLHLQRVLLKFIGGRYNPYCEWHRRHRAIFVHIPRTGGTSMAFALGAPKPHIPISRYAAFDRAAFKNYFKFAFVRNPWDRLLSAYTVLRTSDERPNWAEGMQWARTHMPQFQTFESFVLALDDTKTLQRMMTHDFFRLQLDWVTMPHSRGSAVDFLGRFETVAEDFEQVAAKLGIHEQLPMMNHSRHEPYREAYSRKMQKVAAEVYAADIKAFGYKF